MQLTITNISSPATPVPLGDLESKTLAPGESITIDRPAGMVSSMRSLIAALAAGNISVVQTPTAEEIASGFLSPPQAVQPLDVAPNAASALLTGPTLVIRKTFTALATGAADDVTIYAANNLPGKFRVIRAKLALTTAVAASVANVWTRASGAGTQLATFDSSVSLSESTMVSAVMTPGTLEGLFLRRGDRAIAGELILEVVRES